MTIEDIIKSKDTLIVDVRTPQEFAGGNVAESINIPLNELPSKLEFLREQNKSIVLCCASGNRSGQGTQYLNSHGFNHVANGGSWYDVNFIKNN